MKNFLRFFNNRYNVMTHFVLSLWVIMFSFTFIPQPIKAQLSNKNHYKTWMFQVIPFNARVNVKDQFMEDSLTLFNISFLSNPTLKTHGSQIFPI